MYIRFIGEPMMTNRTILQKENMPCKVHLWSGGREH